MAKSPHEQTWTAKTPKNMEPIVESVNEIVHNSDLTPPTNILQEHPEGSVERRKAGGMLCNRRNPPYKSTILPLPGGIRLRDCPTDVTGWDGLIPECLGDGEGLPLGEAGPTEDEDVCIGVLA